MFIWENMRLIDMWVKNRMQRKIDLSDLIINIFKENWHETFVFDAANDVSVTYEEFFSKVILYRKKLKKIGIASGDTLALIMNNSLDLMVLYFSGLIAGVRVVPIDPYKGIRDINDIFDEIKDCFVITDISIENLSVKKTVGTEKFMRIFPKKISVSKSDLNIFKKINFEKQYLIVFTSGSTGKSKGVIHSFGNLINSALNFGKKFNLNEQNIFYHNFPMTYMAGILNQVLMPFIFRSKIVIGDRFSVATVNDFWNFPIKYSVNTFWFNPTTLSLLVNIDRGKQGVTYAANNSIIGFVGTAPLSYSLKQKFEKKYNILLYESYGLSETLFVTTETPGGIRSDGSVGKKLDGVKIKFATDGEILIKSKWTFLGYVGKEKNKEFSANNEFLSGDLGYFDKDNLLHISGRKKDIIIRGGMNISPRKIENFVSDFVFFEENVIIGIEDEVIGEKIVCFYISRRLDTKDCENKINNEIIKKLGKGYKIDQFVKLIEIPKNINGKIDKLKIKDIMKNR
jgi:long-chain acyl-CoA synthetase